MLLTSPSSFRPFPASLVPLEVLSDCSRKVISLFFLLKATVLSETEEGPDTCEFLEAAMIVYNIACFSRGLFARVYYILESVLRAVKKRKILSVNCKYLE